MDALRGAAPLARLLLAVGGARRDGELRIEQHGRHVRLHLRRGELCAVQGLRLQPLGDILRERAQLEEACVPSQLQPGARADALPFGLRLVANGSASLQAVRSALERQHTRALVDLLRLPAVRIVRVHAVPAALRGVVVSASLTSLVWQALLELAAELPQAVRAELAHEGERLTFTPAGMRRLQALAIDVGALEGELSLRAVACALGFALPRARREDTYALLLRKRRELARNAGPGALLDLPRDATPERAQRALRKLAIKLHPDHFHTHDARLQQLSHEVMGALTRAASSFGAGGVGRARSM
jgi:hypothetical protein